MIATRLPFTQGQLVPPGVGPCASIAVLVGHALLQTADAAAIARRVRLGCDVHATLAAPGEILMPAQVLAGVDDARTGAAPWVHVVELVGVHLPPGARLAPASRDFIDATAAISCDDPARVDVPLETVPAGLVSALERVEARARLSSVSLAAAVTYAGHTIVVAAVHDTWGLCFSAVDSLTGEFVSVLDDSAPLFAHVAAVMCAPRPPDPAPAATAADTAPCAFVANVFRLAIP